MKKVNAIDIDQFFKTELETLGDYQLISFRSSDSFLERIITKKLSSLNCKIINAKEVTIDWLTENTSNYDLFSGMSDETENGFIFINSESLNSECQKYILEFNQNLTKKLVLLFNRKNELMNKLAKVDSSIVVDITAPKPRDMGKYFCTYLGLLEVDFENGCDVPAFKDKDFSTAEVAQIADAMIVDAGNGKITRSEVSKKLESYLDSNFKLFDYLNAKNYRGIYQALDKVTNDPREFRSKIILLQNHLFKIKYPSYLEYNKKKPSFFDEKISKAKHNWSMPEIQDFLEELGHFELASKNKEIRLDQLLKTKKGRRVTSPIL